MDDNEALLWVGESLYGTENSSAVIGSVTRVDVHMERAKAEGTVISRRVTKGQNLFSAILAGEALVIFSKTLVFHF